MRSSTLITSALAAGAVAIPQGQLEKRQVLTVIDTFTVTTTVFVGPSAAPTNPSTTYRNPGANKGGWVPPPRPFNPPNTRRPTNVPPPPVVTYPRPDATRTSGGPSTDAEETSTSTTVGTGGPTSPPLPTTTTSTTSSSAIVGSGISNAPGSTTTTGTSVPSNVPVDPGHESGEQQALLTPADGDAYKNSILFHHNKARANHGSVPLVWNDTVAATAKAVAETCNFEHYFPPGVPPGTQGQNLFTISGQYFNVTTGITESWYKDEFPPMVPYFGQASIPDDVFAKVGHLTQLLWNGTTSVGCYSLDCSGRMIVDTNTNSPINKYTVCDYYPAGNVGGQYADNIGDPIDSVNLGSWKD